jgi:transcriptional regulator with XRE-family HTH domain
MGISIVRGSMSTRSLRVKQDCIDQVKLALRRNRFPSQRALAEDAGFALATVSNFLTGRPVDYKTFEELCRRLALDWSEIANLDLDIAAQTDEVDSSKTKTLEKLADGSARDDSGAIDPHSDSSPCYPNGSVPLGSPFYLERVPFEAQIDREMRKPGALVRIKAPNEMGKTSLLMRILDSARQIDYRTVSLNLEQVDRSILGDLNQFLRWLCANAARQLQLKPNLDEYWDEDLGSKISCTAYFEDYLLAEINTPLIFAIDEVNQLFEHPQVAKDFLPLLRSWYEEAKTLPIWQKLRLIVVHSTEIYVPLDLNQSPFNVGLPVQLNKFSSLEVQRLAKCYGIDWQDPEEFQQLMDMVMGHPSLVHTAIYHLSRGDITLLQLLETAPTATGIYQHHLQRHWVTLAEQPELAQALDLVISSTQPMSLDPIVAHKLSSLGLIERFEDKAILGCELYRQAFKLALKG